MSDDLFYGYTPIAPGNQVYLERPRINRSLEKAIQKPIVSVVAGAGYGKTYAVYAFARAIKLRTAWIQCSERDNTGVYFWENFISTVSIISKDTAEKLKRMDLPVTDRQFERFLSSLRRNILPKDKYLFVYDDIHLITDRRVLRFLELSVKTISPNICSVIISRSEPSLNLTEPESKNLLARITGDELRFSQDEMVSYFRLQKVSLEPRMTSVIYHDTEGWALAIHLAGLSLRNAPGAAYVSQALRLNTFRLIESEIMAPLSPELRSFLIKMSLLENLNPGLLKETGKDDSLIKEMERIGSFIRYDKDLDSYHIHHLFMDYLRGKQDELRDEEKKDVWTNAAIWYAANNRKMDAIISYAKAGDYKGIAEIFRTLPLILPAQMARFILDILAKGSKKTYSDCPSILMVRCRTLLSLGLFEQGRAELREMIPGIMQMPDSLQKHRILLAVNLNHGFIGFFESVHTRRYDFAWFFAEAAREKRLAEYTVEPPVSIAVLSSYVCRVNAPASKKDIEAYIAMLGEIVPDAVEAMGGCQAGMHDLALGEYAFFRGELIQAEKHLLESITKAREYLQFETENRALFYLLRVHLCRGVNPESILSQLDAELEEDLFVNRYIYHSIITGWYNIQLGLKNPIAFWLKSDYEKSGLNARAQGLEILVKAKYFFSEKRYPAALAAMESRGDAESLLMGDVEMKALEAVCRYRLQDRKAAYTALEEAYCLAAPAGLFMPFTELGKDMRALAETAIRDAAAGNNAPALPPEWLEETRRNAVDYARKLYRQTERARPGPGYGDSGALSRREREILTGLSHGLTRDEIAETASISPNTVKSIIRSVYNKLGALNQADAVRIATEKNILKNILS